MRLFVSDEHPAWAAFPDIEAEECSKRTDSLFGMAQVISSNVAMLNKELSSALVVGEKIRRIRGFFKTLNNACQSDVSKFKARHFTGYHAKQFKDELKRRKALSKVFKAIAEPEE